MEQYKYRSYEEYQKAQLKASNEKMKRMNVNKHIAVIGNIKEQLLSHLPGESLKILCVGARNCNEIRAFRTVLPEKNLTIRAIDLSERFFDECDIFKMDMNYLTFNDNAFDIIYAHHSLEHNIKPQLAATEFIRVIKPGGIIYITIPLLYEADARECTVFRKDDLPGMFRQYTDEILLSRLVRKGDDAAEGNEFRFAFMVKKP